MDKYFICEEILKDLIRINLDLCATSLLTFSQIGQ